MSNIVYTYTFRKWEDGQDFCSDLLDNCGSLVDARFSNGKVVATGDSEILADWCNDSRVKRFYKMAL